MSPTITLLFEIGLNLELTNSARLAGQQASRIFPSQCPHQWDHGHASQCLALMWELGFLMLAQPALYFLSHLHSPEVVGINRRLDSI